MVNRAADKKGAKLLRRDEVIINIIKLYYEIVVSNLALAQSYNENTFTHV